MVTLTQKCFFKCCTKAKKMEKTKIYIFSHTHINTSRKYRVKMCENPNLSNPTTIQYDCEKVHKNFVKPKTKRMKSSFIVESYGLSTPSLSPTRMEQQYMNPTRHNTN